MSEYIKREDAIEAVRKAYVDYIPILYGRTQEIPLKVDIALTNIPSADVVEPKRGEWIESPFNEKCKRIVCSECGNKYLIDVTLPLEVWMGEKHRFCGSCGADMRGDKE